MSCSGYYNEGFDSPISVNPYRKGTFAFVEWQRGYVEGHFYVSL